MPRRSIAGPTSLSALLRLYLIRHGETEWSRSGQHTGRTEVPLTARGEEGALELAPILADIGFARVFVSPRLRAQRTCELAGLAEAAEIEPDLAEWDYGDYEGKRSSEILQERPGWNIFRDGAPRGESPAEIAARADRLIQRLRSQTGNIALFSHGHFGRVLAARWIGASVELGQHLALSVAAVNILSYEASHPETPVIALWNFSASERID